MLRRWLYFLGKALESTRRSPGVSALTAGTIGASLLVMGSYVVALQNLERLTLTWGRNASVSVYLEDALPQAKWQAKAKALRALPGVAAARLVSPEQALARFRSRGGRARELAQGVPASVLPASIELSLESGFIDLHAVRRLADAAAAVPGVQDVDFGESELTQLRTLLETLRRVGIAAGALLAVVTAFIVSNTIRLTVYARREEIAIVQLVGGTRWFVRSPFLLEGALWGLAGGLGAVLLLAGAQMLLAQPLSSALGGMSVHLLNSELAGAVLAGGMVLGVGGSALAVGRFLELERL